MNMKTSDSLSQFVIKPIAAAYASRRSFVLADRSQELWYMLSHWLHYSQNNAFWPHSIHQKRKVNLRWSHEELLNIQLIQQERPPNAIHCHAHMWLAVRYLQKFFNVLVGEERTEIIFHIIKHHSKTEFLGNWTQRIHF